MIFGILTNLTQFVQQLQRQYQGMMDRISNFSFQEDDKIKHPPRQREGYQAWNELFLNENLKRIIRQLRFDRPSEVQSRSIPIALTGRDLICQSKSGTGKTMVFVISVLQTLITDKAGRYVTGQAFVIANTRELAHQIYKDFLRLSKYFRQPPVNISCYFGGLPFHQNVLDLKNPQTTPHIVIGTPGRLLDLTIRGPLTLKNCNCFIIDQCDKILESPTMGELVITLLGKTPLKKQMMMFSATLNEFRQKEYKKYMTNPEIVQVDEGKLILQGLTQFYLRLPEEDKFDKLIQLLDTLAFNQVIIFVNRVERAKKLTDLLRLKLFNPICIHSALQQEERIKNYDLFKANESRLLVATDLFGRGIDIERVNLVINFDFPPDRDTYLHRVGRAGRFNTKGLAINILSNEGEDDATLMDIQNGFKVMMEQLPSKMDPTKYI